MNKLVLFVVGVLAATAFTVVVLRGRPPGEGPTHPSGPGHAAGAVRPAGDVHPAGDVERAGPLPTVARPAAANRPAPFPIGVWLQDPAFNARQYRDMGVNTFVGLWKFPALDTATPGWAQAALDALVRTRMTAVAGETPETVRATLKLPHNRRITAWLAGDEPDMSPLTPAQWRDRIQAMRAVQDRTVYGNFGKSFGGFDWWHDHLSDADKAAYCAPVDIASVDYYGMTDHTEAPNHRGPWTYGRAVDNLQKACGPDKPTYAFVETAQPSNESPNAATPTGIRAAAWNAIIHGADGLEYFVHDFYCADGCGDKAFTSDPEWAGNRRAVTRLDAEIHRYDAALTSPDVQGVTTSTGIPLALLTKRVGGTTYVFAQADGSASRPEGYSGQATVRVAGHTFSDHWDPYQVRVYTVRG